MPHKYEVRSAGWLCGFPLLVILGTEVVRADARCPLDPATLGWPYAYVWDAFVRVALTSQLAAVPGDAGVLTTVAGNGLAGFSGDGGPATAARLNNPFHVAVDSAGNLYVADSGNSRIRKVTPSGTISTAAGTGVVGFSGDGGPAIAAQLACPDGLAVDGAGNLYVADNGNHRIRRVTPAGVISTLTLELKGPVEVAVDSAGNLYITDSGKILKMTPAGVVSTLAGTGVSGFEGDGGPASAAQLAFPKGLALDGAGNLYIADAENHRIRRITAAGVISTVAGTGVLGVLTLETWCK